MGGEKEAGSGEKRTRVFSQNSRCQARHIPEIECAAPLFTHGTFTQCAASQLNVPGPRMYVSAGLCIYPEKRTVLSHTVIRATSIGNHTQCV